ncbi:peptidase S8/S53 domain-containing protein, partial [Jimgerdemannia flammicorona]
MKQNVSSRSSSFKKHLSWIRDLDRNASAPSSLSSDVGAIGRFQWYSGSFDYDTLAKINQSNVVECVIEDTLFKLQEKVQQGPPSWVSTIRSAVSSYQLLSYLGLDRIDQRSGLDGLFHFPSSSGAGVNVYVIDTGINIEHTDFVGRASYGPSFIGNESDPTDTNGHGTFVAGVCCGECWKWAILSVAHRFPFRLHQPIGTNYGVAKKANVISVKALNSDGSGRLSNVLAALSWVVEQHTTSGNTSKTVVNLSLGAEYSEVTNNAIEQAIEQGIHFTIACNRKRRRRRVPVLARVRFHSDDGGGHQSRRLDRIVLKHGVLRRH